MSAEDLFRERIDAVLEDADLGRWLRAEGPLYSVGRPASVQPTVPPLRLRTFR